MDLSPAAKRAFQIQSYGPSPRIDGVEIVELKRFADDGGSMTELARLREGHPEALAGFTVRQINVWYVPPSDRMLLVLLDVRQGSKTEGARMRFTLGAGNSRLVRIPPGVAHGVRNLAAAPGRIIYFTDVHFSPEPATCDEGRLPWDHAGAEIWDVTRG